MIDSIPEIKTIIVEEEDPEGPYGAKGMGEVPVNPTAPAILNAIYNAVGIRFNKIPVTRKRLLEELQK